MPSNYDEYLNNIEINYDEDEEAQHLRDVDAINREVYAIEQREDQQEYDQAVKGGGFSAEPLGPPTPEASQAPSPEPAPEAPQTSDRQRNRRSSSEASPQASQGQPDASPGDAEFIGPVTPEEEMRGRKEAMEDARFARNIPGLRELDKLQTAAGTAVGDTLFDFLGKLGWQEGEDWWDEHNPSYNNKADQAGREALSLIVPTLIVGGGVTSAGMAAARSAGVLTGKTATVLGALAAEAGADVLVTGVSDVSERDENISNLLNDTFGVELPWAVMPGDSPDLIRKKNIYEAGAFTAATSAIELIGLAADVFKGAKKTQLVPLDESAVSKADDIDDVISEKITNAKPEVIQDDTGLRVETPPPRVDNTSPKLQRIDDEIRAIDASLASYADEVANAEKAGIPLDAINDGLGPSIDDAGALSLNERKARLLKRREKVVGKATEPIGQGLEDAKLAREEAQVLEGQARLMDEMMTGKEGEYDAFINSAGDNNAKAVMGSQASPKQAQLDIVRIERNLDTNYGRPNPVATEHFIKRTLSAPGMEARREDLMELFQDIAPQFDAWFGGTKVTAEEIGAATKRLTDKIFFDGEGGFDDFIQTMNEMKRDVFNSQEILDVESFQVASNAIKEGFEMIFDPKQMQASALLANQAAGDVADIATAARIVDQAGGSPQRQFEMAFDRLKLLSREVRAAQYARGKALQMMNLAREAGGGDIRKTAEAMQEALGEVKKGFSESMSKSDKFFDTVLAMTREDSEYLKPLLKVWQSTDGKIDDLASMTKYLEKKIGVIGKAFIDGDPEIPSLVVQGLLSTKYNNILNGQAPIRAAVGNATMLITKPATTLMGNAVGVGDIRRTLYTYGGFAEAFQRGLKNLKQTWKQATSNPELLAQKARDFNPNTIKDFEALEAMADVWRSEGNLGRVAAWNMAKTLSWWNGTIFQKWGVSSLTAIDGFTNAFLASANARARAYDEVLEATNGVFDPGRMKGVQEKLYNTFFDKDGVITDSAVAYTAKEITLQLDNKASDMMDGFLKKFPAAKGLFMFPRTGANAARLSWTYVPGSGLMGAMNKQSKVIWAKTAAEKMDALKLHGFTDYSESAFQALKAEYIGRQLMGSALVMGVGMLALNGQITGSGPRDGGQKQRMIESGWKPYSIQDPTTGRWFSYQGLDPFQTVLGLAADFMYEAHRLDEDLMEEWWAKLGFSITANITSKTFMSGFEPLMDLATMENPAAFQKYLASELSAQVPQRGAVSLLNKIVTPQLKDVERDFAGYMANNHKFIFQNEEKLLDYKDFYTGKPVRGTGNLIETIAQAMPVLSSSGGTEPWRQWMLAQGWDGMSRIRANPITKEAATPEQRQFIHEFVGSRNLVVPEIEKLMNNVGNKLEGDVARRRAAGLSSDEVDIGNSYVHKALDKIHRDAIKQAWDEWYRLHPEQRFANAARGRQKLYQGQGKVDLAIEEAKKLQQLKSITDY